MQWARQKANGFTIVELLIVIVVIAILAAITIVAYNGIQNRAKDAVLRNDIAQAVRKIETDKAQSSTQQYPLVSGVELRVSSGVTLTYSPNATANTYCVSASNSQASYFATNFDTSIRSGDCVQREGLVVWVPMNGTADNLGSFGGSLTVNGATLAVGQDGRANGAYQFSAETNLTQESPGTFPAITGSAWVYATSFSGSPGILNGINASGPTHWELQSGKWRLRLSGVDQTAIASAALNVWSHVAFSYVRSTGALNYYVNGEKVVSSTGNTGQDAYFSGGLVIGQSNGASRQWYGRIDDVRIYNRALSDADIQTLYSAGAQ